MASFALTVRRQLEDIEALLARIEEQAGEVEELDIADIDIEDPAFESLLVGRKVKVLLQDVDPVRWRQDLIEDRNRLATLHAAASQVTADRDAKLAELRETIERKCLDPINAGNRKVIVFTAFADTARYLYDALAPWAQERLGVQAALVTGAGANRTTCRMFGAISGPSWPPRASDPGAAERPCVRRRDRSSDRNRLHLRRPEPPGL